MRCEKTRGLETPPYRIPPTRKPSGLFRAILGHRDRLWRGFPAARGWLRSSRETAGLLPPAVTAKQPVNSEPVAPDRQVKNRAEAQASTIGLPGANNRASPPTRACGACGRSGTLELLIRKGPAAAERFGVVCGGVA